MDYWFSKAFVGMLLISPLMLVTGVAERNFGIRSEVTALLWMQGVSVGLIACLVQQGRGHEILAVSPMWFAILLYATIAGGPGNVLAFQALVIAPNPGLVSSILNGTALVAFILAPALALLSPTLFPPWQFSWREAFGVVLMFAGAGLIATK